MAEIDSEKYVTFHREALYQLIGLWSAKWMPHVETPLLLSDIQHIEVDDAVVIRRQDKFASPCLLTYATMISMVAENHPELYVRNELRAIADYFHQQGTLAGDEGFKLPDL